MTRRVVSTEHAPAAIGPYSQGIVADGWLFTAGQIALDPATGEMVGETAAEQTQQALANARAVIEAAGLSLTDVVKVTIFIKDMREFGAINEVYQAVFSATPPARSVVEVARLPKDALVEMEMIAHAISG